MSSKPIVLIAGGGVAAVEALLVLRESAADTVDVELVSGSREFAYRPLAVAESFDLGPAPRFDLEQVADDTGARLRVDMLDAVDPERQTARARSGIDLPYDYLLVATGSQAREAVPGALTYRGLEDAAAYRTLLQAAESGDIARLVFAVPSGVTWPLPLYELALITAVRLRERGMPTRISLVTPEDAPLLMFGRRASDAVAELLDEHNIELRTAATPVKAEASRLALVPGNSIPADRVVALPHLRGVQIAGLPHDGDGFLNVDEHCRLSGVDRVFAAGDVTDFPVKQGGIATQQADAAAEAIAAEAGAPVEPKAFRPVLRGVLLTGEGARYLRAEISGGHGDDSQVSEHQMWWPGGKIAGRFLSHYLARRAEPVEPAEPLPADAIPIEIDLRGMER